MKEKVDIVYKKFNKIRKSIEIKEANKQDLVELEELEKIIKI